MQRLMTNVHDGTCMTMCPDAEIREREDAGLIHLFERLDVDDQSSKNKNSGRYRPGQRGIKKVRADKNKTVKEYNRPAAGMNKLLPSNLRPVPVLKKTVAYLCTKILTRTDQPFWDVYQFIFDRLRAVRQDMVIQRVCDSNAIILYESIVKFHLYAEYKLRYCRIADPFNARNGQPFNQQHLRECLKDLLNVYEANEYNGSTRPFFEALYCLLAPESYEVISRACKIKKEMENDTVFRVALEICLVIQQRNFYKFFKLLHQLPPLLVGFSLQHVPLMRTHALKAISVSYGVKTCKIPLDWIVSLLCYTDSDRAEQDLKKIGCVIINPEDGGKQSDAKFVIFSKTTELLNPYNEIKLDTHLTPTLLSGLEDIEVLAKEQICPWSNN